jgi:RNA ligase (TIGR02306 family)
MNSSYKAEVYPITLEKHPNADTLSIIKIDDYTYVAKTEEWKNVKKAVFIMPDSLVNTDKPEFNFLKRSKQWERVKAKKIRGCISYGVLIPVEDEAIIGEDRWDKLEIKHYDPEITNDPSNKKDHLLKEQSGKAPKGCYPKYDLDNFQKYGRKAFEEGELCFVSEKVNGENSRYIYQNSEYFCGSRGQWKNEFSKPPNITVEQLVAAGKTLEQAESIYNIKVLNHRTYKSKWWGIFEQYMGIKKFITDFENYVLYGEIFGSNKNMKYGCKDNELRFAAFDIMKPDGKWLDVEEFLEKCNKYEVPHVPIIARSIPFNFEEILNLASGPSLFPGANHYREGIVIKPLKERWHEKYGRVCLKCVSAEYLEKN